VLAKLLDDPKCATLHAVHWIESTRTVSGVARHAQLHSLGLLGMTSAAPYLLLLLLPLLLLPLLLLQLLQGGTLMHKVSASMISPGRQVYSNAQALSWALDVASALQYLHQRSPAMLHRDVKLSNVLLAKQEAGYMAKLSDFGLHVVRQPARSTTKVAHVTTAGRSLRHQQQQRQQQQQQQHTGMALLLSNQWS
jgi:serine/threonine protein kinase